MYEPKDAKRHMRRERTPFPYTQIAWLGWLPWFLALNGYNIVKIKTYYDIRYNIFTPISLAP